MMTDNDPPPEATPSSGPHDKILRRCMVILTILGVLYTLYFVRALILPLFLAILLSLLLSPLVRFLKNKLSIPSSIGAGAILLSLLAAVVIAGVFAVRPASDWVQAIPSKLPDLKYQLSQFKVPFAKFTEATQQVQEMTTMAEETEKQVVQVTTPPLSSVVMQQTPIFFANLLLMFILLFFLLAAGDTFLRKLVQSVPKFEDKRRTVEIVHEIEHRIASYLGAITLINLGLGTAIGLAAWWVGFNNAFLWGFLAFALNYIPYLGAIVGAIAALVVGLLTFPEPSQALALPAIYVACNIVEGNLITPLLVSRILTLNSVVVFVSIMFWGWLWNVPGALLAVPILAATKIVCDHVDRLKPFGAFIGGDPKAVKSDDDDD